MPTLEQIPLKAWQELFAKLPAGGRVLGWLLHLDGFIRNLSERDPFNFSNGGRAVQTNPTTTYLEESDVTSTELGYSEGLDSNIQNQLDSKLNTNATGSTTIAYDDVVLPIYALKSVGSGVPSFTEINSTGLYAYEFTDEAVLVNEKRGAINTELPHRYKPSTDAELHVHFITGARVPGVDEYVRFTILCLWLNEGDQAAPAGVVTTNINILIPSGTAAYTSVYGDMAELAQAGQIESSQFLIMVRRNSNDAGDTYTDSIWPIAVGIHYQVEKAGSATEHPTP